MSYFHADRLKKQFVGQLKFLKPDKTLWTDKSAAATFANFIRGYARYDATAKGWRVYDGCIWALDVGDMRIRQLAKVFSDALTAYASQIGDEKQRIAFFENALRYQRFQYRETLIKDTRDEAFLTADDLDRNDDLFNCLNGTLNLRTMEFYNHRPNDLLSKVANVEYKPGVKAERPARLFHEVSCGDNLQIRYLQKLLGYNLTAGTELETCWLLFGSSTRNGKSTCVEFYAYMMGDYAATIQPETLAQKQNRDSRNASGDIARLAGVRFVNCSEPPKRMLFDAALLKQMLGRDTITARHIYEREFEFVPKFKLMINTNHLPLVTDDTLFASGRINVIPFNRHFAPNEQDHGLKEELKKPENLSWLLNWALEGLILYREEGLTPPPSVEAATAEYRKSSDKIGRFLDECLDYTGKNTPAGTVYDRYSAWCNENGYGCESKATFYDDLRCRGIFTQSGTVNGRTVRNIVKGYETK